VDVDGLLAQLPVEPFLKLEQKSYTIPSNATCGTAANLYLRVGDRSNWVGVWNYGRGVIPKDADAGMYEAVVKYASSLIGQGEEMRNEVLEADRAAKKERMRIDPNDLFKLAPEYKGKYSKFSEETGIPTHLADGTELTKSAIKNLSKVRSKHVKQREKALPGN